jgi:hypothetical protein
MSFPLLLTREKRALQVFLNWEQTIIVSAADATPADKYGFAPTDGEFKGVRTLGQQVKHLAAANHILAAAALSEETVPNYLHGSFASTLPEQSP